MRYSSRRLMAAAIMTAGVPLALLAGPGTAHAAVAPAPRPCAGTGCTDLDPTLSYLTGSSPRAFCNAGSSTLESMPVYGGTLQLRWGPNCRTKWARFTPHTNDTYAIGVYGSANGIGTGFAGDGDHVYTFSGQGITFYSDQVYSPGPGSPCVADVTLHTGLYCPFSK